MNIELRVKFISITIILNNSLLERHWSTTHGFFITMGGFHLFERSSEKQNDSQNFSQEDDNPLHPLLASDLMLDDVYSFTMLSKAEIKDKGKGDSLAKSLVLLQTSWFVMQCIARAIEHFPVTHLEIVTLAYAAMNFVIYVFWWNKPLNVNQPVRVFRKFEPRETQPEVNEPISRKLTWETVGEGLKTILWLILGAQDENVDLNREDRVPRFWSDDQSGYSMIADVVVLGVGICFGAIHCIAWLFSLPTYTELLMWRISSAAITSLPIYIPLVLLLGALLIEMDFKKSGYIIGYLGTISGGILYILARAVTLILAFASLRDLPPGAYETVHWTTFIPHV